MSRSQARPAFSQKQCCCRGNERHTTTNVLVSLHDLKRSHYKAGLELLHDVLERAYLINAKRNMCFLEYICVERVLNFRLRMSIRVFTFTPHPSRHSSRHDSWRLVGCQKSTFQNDKWVQFVHISICCQITIQRFYYRERVINFDWSSFQMVPGERFHDTNIKLLKYHQMI